MFIRSSRTASVDLAATEQGSNEMRRELWWALKDRVRKYDKTCQPAFDSDLISKLSNACDGRLPTTYQ